MEKLVSHSCLSLQSNRLQFVNPKLDLQSLQSLVAIKDGVLSVEECKEYLELLDEYPSKIEEHDSKLYKFRQLNLHTTNELPLIKKFANRVLEEADGYFTERNLRQYIPEYGFEQVRIKHYPKNTDSQFRPHVDCYDTESSKRFLIAIVYLNYNNGVTRFTNLGIDCEPKPGRLLLFPPMWMFPHSGEAPTDTDKFIMMTSLNYLPGQGVYR